MDNGNVKKLAEENDAERYVKKFSTYNHLIFMLFCF
ncbi:DUF4372 domain-containing protein [Arachidicoccus terrestris]|nr:DUF4372 domain-containing protein [Arachidicoccus terrestris]